MKVAKRIDFDFERSSFQFTVCPGFTAAWISRKMILSDLMLLEFLMELGVRAIPLDPVPHVLLNYRSDDADACSYFSSSSRCSE